MSAKTNSLDVFLSCNSVIFLSNKWEINTKLIHFFVSEREENVKADIFAAYITLLRQTRPVASQALDAKAMEDDSG